MATDQPPIRLHAVTVKPLKPKPNGGIRTLPTPATPPIWRSGR